MLLLAVKSGVILDVAFFVILILGISIGAWRGFVKGICRLAGTIFSIAVAIFFCVPLKNNLESWFGLSTRLAEALGGNTVAATAADWILIAGSFIILVLLVKLGAWMIGKVGTKLVSKSKTLRFINKLLGSILGLVKALLICLIVLAIFKWLNLESVNEMLSGSAVVGAIYRLDWFAHALQIT